LPCGACGGPCLCSQVERRAQKWRDPRHGRLWRDGPRPKRGSEVLAQHRHVGSGDAKPVLWRNDPAQRAAPGTSSRRSSSRFAVSSAAEKLTPVRLLLGRERLATRPTRTGSSPTLKTMGIVVVAPLAASAETNPPVATMTATCLRTRSPPELAAGRPGSRPSDSRSQRCRLPNTLYPSGLGVIREEAAPTRQAIVGAGIR
jgi:hypothetical protein